MTEFEGTSVAYLAVVLMVRMWWWHRLGSDCLWNGTEVISGSTSDASS